MGKRPNVVFVFSDQHRADAAGYAGNCDVLSPHMDRLHGESVSFRTAVANSPVCCPARASLLTGQRSLTHGVFVNDVGLSPDAVTVGKLYQEAGYRTAYIGKWHVDGNGRMNYIPPERRQGFEFWRAMECTHQYNESYYYADHPQILKWEGYDAEAQTACACDYIQNRDRERPFLLFLSWGPPHSPYHTAPDPYKRLYSPDRLTLRPNVPAESSALAREMLAGYYAHVTALDVCLGAVWNTLKEEGIEEDTIFIYTSDHGDMLGSHGQFHKQKPWDESIRVPFLLHYPRLFGRENRQIDAPFGTIDILPTLLALCEIEIPPGVEGTNFAPYLTGESAELPEAALIECVHPFGQWSRAEGGREYRGIRTARYTYVRDLSGPWLLYDNVRDPYQLRNLLGTEEGNRLLPALDDKLMRLLESCGDAFLPGERYIERWGYVVDETGTVPY